MSNTEEKKDVKHEFTWKVEKFSMCSKKKGEKILSHTFIAKSFDETAWCLELYPRGEMKSGDSYTSLFLRRKVDDAVRRSIDCEFALEIIATDGHAVVCNKGIVKFEKGSRWGFYNYIKADELVKALFDDTLIVRCTLCGNMPKKCYYSQNICTTIFKTSDHSFQWVVKNLNSITHEVFKIPFSGTSHLEVTIRIPEDDVKICLIIDENNFSSSQFISCNFILLDVEEKERESKRETHLFESAETWEFPTFIKKSRLNAEKDLYLKDDCFILQCDISVSNGSIAEKIEDIVDIPFSDKFPASNIDTFAVLKADIRRLHIDKIHTDLKLKTGKQVFPAHKCILCARSPVFKAMFDNDMAESQKGEVEIPDLNAKTVDLFLEYIYTGTVSDFDYENAMKLIVAAEKYQVSSLKNKCAELLISILSDSNVCEVLVTADLVQHDVLKVSVINYIKMQPKKLFNSEKWKHFVKNNLELATETVCEVSTFWGDQAKELTGK